MWVDTLQIEVTKDRERLGRAAAERVAEWIRVRDAQPRIRIAFAAAPSQDEFLAALRAMPGLPWARVEAFQLDDYVGLAPSHPASFSSYLRQHLFDHVKLAEVHTLDGSAEPQSECGRYEALLRSAPLDIACLGIGENGHLAFNDPPVADFTEAPWVKVVELDQPCREQQVHDGCFAQLSDVPTHAFTLTIPALMSAAAISCVVPGTRKRDAVRKTVRGPIETACPASVLRRHSSAVLWLDRDSAETL